MDTINLSKLANHIQAIQSGCTNEWVAKHTESIEELCKALPHGSGIDGKCEIQIENCKKDKLCFFVEFHHMDEHGFYDGWTEHNIFVAPSLIHGFEMRITGKNRNGIKEYFYDLFGQIFTTK